MNRRIVLMSWTQALLAVMCLVGCSSTHNLRTDGHNPLGGGFSDEEIRPGLFHLFATGNMSPWPSFSAAIGTWRSRADQLCGTNAYQEIVGSRSAGDKGTTATYAGPGLMLNLPKYNTSVSGYILCDSSGITLGEAVKYLDDLADKNTEELTSSRRRELDELGGEDCTSNGTGTSAENLYRRGQTLSAMNDYKSAMVCFMRAQEQEQGTSIYKESCSAIGMMYELGWGVDKDVSTAMSWYHKAGF